MTERWTTSKDKLARAAAVSGLAAGLTATSLIGGPTANAWCVGISGINIGAGCASTLGNIALGLGPNAVANSNGLSLAVALGDAVADSTGVLTLAMAGGTSEADTNGIANVAVAAGTGDVTAIAGSLASDFLNFAVNFGNATSPAVSLVEADFGGLNVAANLGGNANSQKRRPLGAATSGSPARCPNLPRDKVFLAFLLRSLSAAHGGFLRGLQNDLAAALPASLVAHRPPTAYSRGSSREHA